MDNERMVCTITWYIENASFYVKGSERFLVSPMFTAQGLEGTVWVLIFSPTKKVDRTGKPFISFILSRCDVDGGPEIISLKYELSIGKKDGSILKSIIREKAFKKGSYEGDVYLLSVQEIASLRMTDYQPENTLIVQCNMWRGEGTFPLLKQVVLRTRIGVKHVSFLHVTESFSSVIPPDKKEVTVKFLVNAKVDLSCCLYCTDINSESEGEINVKITPSNPGHVLSVCKLFVLDAANKLIPCGEADIRFDHEKPKIDQLSLSFSKQMLLNMKDDYLPEDKLTLLCECILTTGVEYEEVEKFLHVFNRINNNNNGIPKLGFKMTGGASALEDFKEIYNNQILTDVELKTKTKSFPAHKIVLCARSSVFKAMFSNDMKEKNTYSIEVDDLEDDTVHQLLLFLYSDGIENLQWESAFNLYYAADKYDIKKLKLKCANYLLENLTTSSASDLLLLAENHNDFELKKFVEDFIFKHEKAVFSSDEWRNLIETNPILVSKTMCLKYTRAS